MFQWMILTSTFSFAVSIIRLYRIIIRTAKLHHSHCYWSNAIATRILSLLIDHLTSFSIMNSIPMPTTRNRGLLWTDSPLILPNVLATIIYFMMSPLVLDGTISIGIIALEFGSLRLNFMLQWSISLDCTTLMLGFRHNTITFHGKIIQFNCITHAKV